MFKTFTRLAAALVCAAVLPVAAHATIVEYDFTGNVVAGPAGAPLNGYVQANNHISGFFRFDASTAPTTPGNWDLSTAVFHVQFDMLTLDSVGATAHVSLNQDLLTFTASIPPADFPFPVTSASLGLGFQTFIDGYYSLTSLPTWLPPNDHTLGLSVSGPWGTDGASTDTELFITARTVPEPAPIAVVLASLLGFGWMVRRRLNAGSVRS